MKLSKLLKEVASDHRFSLNEIDGGQLFDFFSRKGYEVEELGAEKDSVQKYVVADESENQFVHFQYNRYTDEFTVSQMSGYRIDQSKANRAGMRRSRDASEVGKTVYMTDGNYTPVEIDAMELRNLVTHVMTGLDREAKAQQDFYAKNPLADGIAEVSVDTFTEIKEKIKDLVQQLKDESSYLLPDGAKDLAIDMIKKMDIK